MIAEIIAVGSEMLTPFRQDTNSLHLTARLNELGVEVAFKTIVGDSLPHLTNAIRIALQRADLVLISGGLGPTEDDLTREAVAAALAIELHPDNELLTALYKRFAERRMSMPPNNRKQADILDGADILLNRNGSAPGQFLDTAIPSPDGPDAQPLRKIVILLPGPPRELKPLFDELCLPRLAASLPPRHLAKRLLRMALIPESQVDARCAPIYNQYPDISSTILAGSAEIQLHFFCAKPYREEAEARIDELTTRIEAEMGDSIFSANGQGLEEVVHILLGLRNLTLATAESCTGGLLAERLTAIPNSSRTFLGGVVTYSPALKTLFAGVPPDLLEREGTVSEAVAEAMATGIRTHTGASLGIAITGLAGPGGVLSGPDATRPIGLVHIALASERGTEIKTVNLTGDRDRIRLWATQHALEMLRRHLL